MKTFGREQSRNLNNKLRGARDSEANRKPNLKEPQVTKGN
jgi:hypothetical protein